MLGSAIIWFLIGIGLLQLGAFLLWHSLVPLLPSLIVTLIAVWCGYSETAVGVILGAVAINLAAVGLISLCVKSRTRSKTFVSIFWLVFGWGVCMVAGCGGFIGKFSGWSLMVVGAVVIWQMASSKIKHRQTNLNILPNKSKLYLQIGRLILSLALIIMGAWLIVRQHAVIATVLSIPVGILGTVVLAPICSLSVCFKLRPNGQWQTEEIIPNLCWTNALLATMGLGLTIVCCGGLHLTQSMLAITLPCVAGMTILALAMNYLLTKTARWWGGLLVITYLGYVISLLV